MVSHNQKIAEEIDYSNLPEHLRNSLRLYVEKGRPVGHFLTACLSNSLLDAVGRADETNRQCLVEIVQFLWNEFPQECWGSIEKVDKWREKGGLFGKEGEGV